MKKNVGLGLIAVYMRQWHSLVSILFLAAALCSCSILAPFDASTLNESYSIKKEVAILYEVMSDLPPEERHYEQFSRDYANIVASLNGLLQRQARREKNTESTKITKTLLDFVIKYRDAHKKNNTYKDGLIKIHSKRLDDVLQSLIVAEEVKKR